MLKASGAGDMTVNKTWFSSSETVIGQRDLHFRDGNISSVNEFAYTTATHKSNLEVIALLQLTVH